MSHVFYWLTPPARWIVLAILVLGTVGFMIKLSVQGKPLATTAAPQGILSYEFAWTRPQATAIITSWRSGGQLETARCQLWIDFGFLVFYPLLLSLLVSMLAESPRNSMALVGLFLSWALLAAGPLDAVENLALLKMLDHGASQSLARLAGWCAGLKFALVYSGLGYVVLQGLAVGVKRLGALGPR